MQNKDQLFCFPFAGGTASFFDMIEKDLEGIDLVKLEYAGHGTRHKEQFYPDFSDLADDMVHMISDAINGDYALLGYSMGSISVAEVLKRLIFSGLPYPKHVFIAAHEPQTKKELIGFTPDESDEWVKGRTIRFGDVPKELLNNKVFWRTYLPVYRADYTLIAKYEFEKLDLVTSIPATVFYSETDTPLAEISLWNKYFTGDIEYLKYEGGHFFIREHHEEMAQLIKDRLGV